MARSARLERAMARELQAIVGELSARTTVHRQELELEALRVRHEQELDSLHVELAAVRTGCVACAALREPNRFYAACASYRASVPCQ